LGGGADDADRGGTDVGDRDGDLRESGGPEKPCDHSDALETIIVHRLCRGSLFLGSSTDLNFPFIRSG